MCSEQKVVYVAGQQTKFKLSVTKDHQVDTLICKFAVLIVTMVFGSQSSWNYGGKMRVAFTARESKI
jgi:hypothetical protein